MRELAPGTILQGRYAIERLMAEGGSSRLYLGYPLQGAALVAIKELDATAPGADDLDGVEQLQKEHEFLRMLEHPALAPALDLFTEGARHYLVVEFVPGETLEARIERLGPLSVDEAIDVIVPVLDVLRYLHARGVIYRDLKPSNLIAQRDGKVRLVDFGAARKYRQGADHDTVPLGTPGFAAPEQYGTAQSDARSDVYSAGVLLHCMLTGQTPAPERSWSFQPPHEIAHVVPRALSAAVMKAVELSPDQRFQTAEEMALAVLRAVGRVRPCRRCQADIAPHRRLCKSCDALRRRGWQRAGRWAAGFAALLLLAVVWRLHSCPRYSPMPICGTSAHMARMREARSRSGAPRPVASHVPFPGLSPQDTPERSAVRILQYTYRRSSHIERLDQVLEIHRWDPYMACSYLPRYVRQGSRHPDCTVRISWRKPDAWRLVVCDSQDDAHEVVLTSPDGHGLELESSSPQQYDDLSLTAPQPWWSHPLPAGSEFACHTSEPAGAGPTGLPAPSPGADALPAESASASPTRVPAPGPGSVASPQTRPSDADLRLGRYHPLTLLLPFPLKPLPTQVNYRLVGEVTVGSRPCWQVEREQPDVTMQIFVDQEYLRVLQVRYEDPGVGERVSARYPTYWSPEDGVELPWTVVVTRGGRPLYEATSIAEPVIEEAF